MAVEFSAVAVRLLGAVPGTAICKVEKNHNENTCFHLLSSSVVVFTTVAGPSPTIVEALTEQE